MGGIIGKFSFDAHEALARPVLEQMLDASRLRASRFGGQAPGASLEGPTTGDIFMAPGIALGACGDAQLAPESGAHAPSTGSGSPRAVSRGDFPPLRVAADASITNALTLRQELEDLGHAFSGRSTAELVLRAYEQWGTACFTRFRGPFACAIWDGVNRRLVIARDHVGIRPLYFALLPNHGVVFATELRALLRDPGVPREWCAAAIDAYLALGYVPAPLTAYRRVSTLESAHFVVIEGRSLHVERYWDIPAPQRMARAEAIEAVAHDLQRVMTDQAADSEAGGLLYSGGTGSTALLACAPSSVSRVVTVAVDQEAAELARSDRAARHLGHLRDIENVEPEVPLLARELTAIFAQPLADPAAVSYVAMCLAAARHTDCAFAATGAATLWAAHPHHRARRIRPAMLWDDYRRHALYTRGFAWEVRDANPFARHLELQESRGTPDALDRALYVDAHTLLPDSELVLAEHAAAAAGLRLRYPLLDPLLVARAGLIPAALKQHAGRDMYALRLVLARALPKELMPPSRRPRAVHAWLDAALASLVPSILLSPRADARGIVSRTALRQLWEEHRTGKANHGHRLWALLMLEFWFRDSLDGDAAEEPTEYAVLKAA